MPVRVDDGWSYAGLPVVRMENAALAADIVPSLGGKVLHLVDKRADRNVLWRHPRIPPHAGPLQANVDDHYSGGWDDAFPTGSPGRNRAATLTLRRVVSPRNWARIGSGAVSHTLCN